VNGHYVRQCICQQNGGPTLALACRALHDDSCKRRSAIPASEFIDMLGNIGNQRERQLRTLERRARYFDSKGIAQGIDIRCVSAGSVWPRNIESKAASPT